MIPPFDDMTIRYIGDYSPGTGYNTAMRGYLSCLRHLGLDASRVRGMVSVGFEVGSSAEDQMPEDDWTYHYLKGQWDEEPPVNIVHAHVTQVGNFWTGGKYNIAIVAWETDKLPIQEWNDSFSQPHTVVGDLSKFDEVWVPTRWNKRLLEESNVMPEHGIHVIPHAFIPELAKVPYQDRELDEARFYSVGAWNPRKNIEQLFQAYLSTGWMPVKDAVDFQMYSVPPCRDQSIVMAHGNIADQNIKALLESLPGGPTEAPPFGLHTAYTTYDGIAERHAQSHVHVTASRGEGFCLPAMEAAAFGNWVIGGGPWLEELAEVAGTVAEGGLVDLLPVMKVPIAPMPEARGYEVGQKWWHVSMEDMQEAMISAKDALLEEGAIRNREWAERVRAHYSVERIACLVAERLQHASEVLAGSGW